MTSKLDDLERSLLTLLYANRAVIDCG